MVLPGKIGRIALFICTVFAADRLIGFGLKKMYFMQHSGNQFAITYALDSTKADLLILGNSRATHHYLPSVFEDSLKLSCFNAGKDGQELSFIYVLLAGIVKRYIPAYIVLDFNSESLYTTRRTSVDDLNALLPYYLTNSTIKALLIQKRKFERVKQLSSIYSYNSTVLSSAMGILTKSTDNILKGYIPLSGRLNDSTSLKVSDFNKWGEMDMLKWRDFTNIINCCKQNKIKLIVVQSPRFAIQQNDWIKKMADSLLSAENIPSFDYKNDTSFINHPSLFKDAAHLNIEGAALFSTKLSKTIAVEIKARAVRSF